MGFIGSILKTDNIKKAFWLINSFGVQSCDCLLSLNLSQRETLADNNKHESLPHEGEGWVVKLHFLAIGLMAKMPINIHKICMCIVWNIFCPNSKCDPRENCKLPVSSN